LEMYGSIWAPVVNVNTPFSPPCPFYYTQPFAYGQASLVASMTPTVVNAYTLTVWCQSGYLYYYTTVSQPLNWIFRGRWRE
jgi:hypothetical protein